MKQLVVLLCLILPACANPPRCNVRDLHVGDSREKVLAACGAPSRINASGSAESVHEQWVYDKGVPGIRGTYIYIDGGVFSSAQWSG